MTHPDWWTSEPLAPAQKICIELEGRSREVWHHYCELLDSGDKPNHCDIADMLPQLRRIDSDAARLWLSGFTIEALVRLSRRAEAHESSVDGLNEPIEVPTLSFTQLDNAEAIVVLTRLVERLSETSVE